MQASAARSLSLPLSFSLSLYVFTNIHLILKFKYIPTNYAMLIFALVLALTNTWGDLKTSTSGRVGFESLMDQMARKAQKRGFEFNIMVVGKYIHTPTSLPSPCFCTFRPSNFAPSFQFIYAKVYMYVAVYQQLTHCCALVLHGHGG